MKIGYFFNNAKYVYHPGVIRAVSEAKKLLQEAGHELVKCAQPPMDEISEYYSGFMLHDSFKKLMERLNEEVIDDSSVSALKMQGYFRQYLPSWIVENLFNWILPIFSTPLRFLRKILWQ